MGDSYTWILIGCFVIACVVVAAVTVNQRDKLSSQDRRQAVPRPAVRTEAEPPNQLVARREQVGSFIGVGCFLQGLGLLSPFIGYAVGSWALGVLAGIIGAVIGLFMLLVLLVVGSRKALSYRCGNCKNPLASAAVKLCPVCRAQMR